MKKAVYKLLGVLLFTTFLVTGLSLFNYGNARAEETNASGKTIPIELSNMKVENTTDKAGKLDHAVLPWENFRVSADFRLPDSTTIKKGDTTVIGIPTEFQFGNVYNDLNKKFNVVDRKNKSEIVAEAKVDLDKKNLTFTYTDYPSKHAEVSGDFYFFGRVDHRKVSGEKELDFNLDVNGEKVEVDKIKYKGAPEQPRVGIKKEGWQRESKSTDLRYKIKLNADGRHLKNVVVTDNIEFQDGIIDPNSFKVEKGTFTHSKEDGVYRLDNDSNQATPLPTTDYKLTFAEGNKGFTLEFLRDILPTDNIRVLYDVTLGATPPSGVSYHNNAILSADVVVKSSGDTGTSTDETKRIEEKASSWIKTFYGEGFADGKKYGLSILKHDSVTNTPLAGAKFDVYTSDKDGNKYGSPLTTITTDNNGRASIGDLINEYYLLEEVEAPTGYSLPDKATKLLVNVKKQTEANANPSLPTENAVYKIANKKVDEKVEVNGTKTWADDNDKDKNRPAKVVIKLLADGKEIISKEVSADNEWKFSFSDLPKFNAENGKEITYSVVEEKVEGYTPEVIGYNIKNIYTPTVTEISVEKRWDDEGNKDALRPNSIKVQLFANNKEQGEAVVLNEENNWRYTFTNLKAKVSGKAVKYEVREIDVPNGYTVTTSIEGNGLVVLKNTHKPILPPPPPVIDIPPHPWQPAPPPVIDIPPHPWQPTPPPVVDIPPHPWQPTPPPAPQLPPKPAEVKSKETKVLAKTGLNSNIDTIFTTIALLGAAVILHRRKTN